MKNFVALALMAVGVLASVNSADARGRRGRNCCNDCCYSCCNTCCAPCQYEERVVTCFRPVMREKQVECMVNRLVPREVVTTHTCNVLVPEYSQEKRVCTVNTYQPRE